MPGTTGSADFILALPSGTLLRGQYRIDRVLGRPGGFGVTYLAEDVNLQRQVAIKEFLPRELAGRGADRTTVLPHSGQEQDLFEYGLSRFMEEGRLLAMLDDHPNVVRVRSAFPENGTAYLVMNYYEGETLSEASQRLGGKLPPEEAVRIIDQVLDGLTEAHGRGILHRDVKPENIYLRRNADGSAEALLLDFGAARQAVKDKTGMTAVLTPGYAPLEQYSRAGDQGPWTDIYACAAVLYSLITGETPPAAPERIEDDPLVPPREVEPTCSPGVEQAILRGLAMRRGDRPQSAQEFRELLKQTAVAPTKRNLGKPAGIAAGAVALVLTAVLAFSNIIGGDDVPAPPAPVEQPSMGPPGGGEGAPEGGGAADQEGGDEGSAQATPPVSQPERAEPTEPTRASTGPTGGRTQAERTQTVQEEPPPTPQRRPETQTQTQAPPVAAAQPTDAELESVNTALGLARFRLDRTEFVRADSILQAGLNRTGALINQYPRADTLVVLRRALTELRETNRRTCDLIARTRESQCPLNQ